MQKALGVIETYGLLAAVTVADTMVKAANVELIGYELARGSGMAAVKIQGDVGAVKAALASGQAQAEDMGLYRGKNLIPRPAQNLDTMVFNQKTIGYADEEVVKAAKKDNNGSVGTVPATGRKSPQMKSLVSKAKAEPAQDAKAEEKPAPKKTSVKAAPKKPAAKKAEEKPQAKKAAPAKKAPAKKAPAKKAEAGGKRRAKRRTSCDLCRDPRCTRKFGQPHKLCIHFNDNKE